MPNNGNLFAYVRVLAGTNSLSISINLSRNILLPSLIDQLISLHSTCYFHPSSLPSMIQRPVFARPDTNIPISTRAQRKPTLHNHQGMCPPDMHLTKKYSMPLAMGNRLAQWYLYHLDRRPRLQYQLPYCDTIEFNSNCNSLPVSSTTENFTRYEEFSENRDNASSISLLLVFIYSLFLLKCLALLFCILIPSLCPTIAHLTALCISDMAKPVHGILDWQRWQLFRKNQSPSWIISDINSDELLVENYQIVPPRC